MGALDDVAALRWRLTRGFALPQVLTVSQVAAVTGLTVAGIRYRLDAGLLECHQERRNAARLVPIEAVLELCEKRYIVPDWDALT